MRNKSDEFKRIILHFRRKKKKKNIYMARFMVKLKK